MTRPPIKALLSAVVSILFLSVVTGPAAAAPKAPALLAKLTVAVERPAGYDRDKFNLWTTVPGRGCDTRDWVLYRQSKPRQAYCGAENGHWLSAYDGLRLTQASQLDIDHMVPLAEVWASGGRAWNPAQREAYANDLYPRTLIAVSLGFKLPEKWMVA